MKLKRYLSMLLACVMAIGSLTIPTNAVKAADEDVIQLEDLKWEWVDLSTVEKWSESLLSRANVPASVTISTHSICTVGQPVFLQTGNTVAFNCSYSPSSASMDFGVIAPDGKFYNMNAKGGSFNQTIRVNQTGNYLVAIRNNSSQTVRVVGFVDY